MSNFEPGDPARIEVPDDASALDADRWRYYDELAAAGALSHSPDQPQDVHHPSRWRDGLPWLGSNGTQRVPVFFLVVSGLAMVACVLLAFVVRPAAPAAGAALAVNAGPAGQEGGLLPAMTVNVDGARRNLRDLRPALLAVVPAGDCTNCAATLAAADTLARSRAVRLYVANDSATPTRFSTPFGVHQLTADPGTFDGYDPQGLTLLTVRSDGVVTEVLRNAAGATSDAKP